MNERRGAKGLPSVFSIAPRGLGAMLVQTRVKKRKDVSAKWEEIREGHVEVMKRARSLREARPCVHLRTV